MTIPNPITIPDLDSAGPIDPVNDYVIVRQGLADFKATIQQISNPAIDLNDPLPTGLLATDLFLVSRQNPDNSFSNYRGSVAQVSFLPGTVMWFWSASAPLGWSIATGLEDTLLAVKSNSGTYATAGSLQGTWQQADHTLTLPQIPPHTHATRVVQGQGSAQTVRQGNTPTTLDFVSTNSAGGGLPHNHGLTWRPQAAVGLLCRKNP